MPASAENDREWIAALLDDPETAAGKTTKTNKLGYVVALPISFFLANVNAFEIGARSVNPKAETRVVFTGGFLDPGKEATAANTLLEQGVDVLGGRGGLPADRAA